MTKAELIAEIVASVYTNNNGEITGANLQQTLRDMVNYLGDAAVKGIGAIQDGDDGLVTGDSVYDALLNYVLKTTKINNKPLSGDVSLTLDDVPDGVTRQLSSYFEIDTTHTFQSGKQAIKLKDAYEGLWSSGFMSAGGMSDGGGASGTTLEAVWQSLTNGQSPVTPTATTKISYQHIPIGDGLGIDGNGNIYVTSQGSVTSIVVNGNTYTPTSGVITLPDYPTSMAWSAVTGKPTTLSGYGITDASISNGVITLGSNTITPLTSHQTIYVLTLKVGSTTIGTFTPNSADATLTISGSNLTSAIGSGVYHPYGGGNYSMEASSYKLNGATPTLTWDSTNSAWHLSGNFYADGWISAGGVSSGGGSAGIDLQAMWNSLQNNDNGEYGYNRKLHNAHLPACGTGLAYTTDNDGIATNIGIASGYYLPSTSDQSNWNAKVDSSTLANYLPLSAGNNKHLTGVLYSDSSINITSQNASRVGPTDQHIVINGYNDSSSVGYCPGIGFHIPQVTWGTLKLTRDGIFTFYDSTLSGYNGLQAGNIYGSAFIKSGGTSSQFLKADGSVDSTTYAAASALNDYALTSSLGSMAYASTSDYVRNTYQVLLGHWVLENIPKNKTQTGGIGWESYESYPYSGGGFVTFDMPSSLQSLLMLFPSFNLDDPPILYSSIDNAAWGNAHQLAWITSNVASATKLNTARTLWGQSFDGTANVSGTMSGATFVHFSTYSGIGRGDQITSSLSSDDIAIYAYNGSSSANITAYCSNFLSTGGMRTYSNMVVDGDIVVGSGGRLYRNANDTTAIVSCWDGNLTGQANINYLPSYGGWNLTSVVGINKTDPTWTLDVGGSIRCSSSFSAGSHAFLNGNEYLFGQLYFQTGSTQIAAADQLTGVASTGDLGIYVNNGSTWATLYLWASVLNYSSGGYINLQGGFINASERAWTSAPTWDKALYRADTAGHEYTTTTTYYRPIVGNNDYVIGHGFGNSWSLGAFRSNNTDCGMYLGFSWDGAAADTFFYFYRYGECVMPSSLTTGGSISSSGNITATGAVTAGSASSRELKTNVQDMSFDYASRIVFGARPITFDWNSLATSLYDKYVGSDLGFIAQEAEELIPSAVSPIFEKYKRLDYTKFVAPLVCVAQNHEKRIEQLERENKELREELAELKASCNSSQNFVN